ncbi:MAG: FAD-dependent oxidoreductase, partial [Clostridia bacterium]|nr:FAD-dependent oxidoreductase [Clostridia bacterium]
DLNERGYIQTDDFLKTNLPGVFAAGDIREKFLRQVSTAVGDGATAAMSAERYLGEK